MEKIGNEFEIKDNEMLFFVDFNCTLVDYDNITDRDHVMFSDAFSGETVASTKYLNVAINNFIKKTGYTPVICVVTNSSEELCDNETGYPLALTDFYSIFIRRRGEYKNPLSRYLKYFIMSENEKFFKINEFSTSIDDAFDVVGFDEQALSVKMADSFHKCESAKRMLQVLDPSHKSKFVFFAGDSIKDDYPMKYAVTEEGICKFFVYPHGKRKLSYEVMRRFCEAKGFEFSSLNGKGRKIKCFDEFNLKFLSENERQALENYHDGDHVIITQKNSEGLAEGVDKVADLICDLKQKSAPGLQ